MKPFRVSIPNFEGPLDLLLFFVKRNELDIRNISLEKITRDFIAHVAPEETVDVDVNSNFFTTAMKLVRLKLKAIEPVDESADEENEPEPSEEELEFALSRQLLEYQRYKESANHLRSREEDQRLRFSRTHFAHDIRAKEVEAESLLQNVTLFDLTAAFQRCVQKPKPEYVHQVKTIEYKVEIQAREVIDFFRDRFEFHIDELMRTYPDPMQRVVTFLAILELARAHRIRLVTFGQINNIRIRKTKTSHVDHWKAGLDQQNVISI